MCTTCRWSVCFSILSVERIVFHLFASNSFCIFIHFSIFFLFSDRPSFTDPLSTPLFIPSFCYPVSALFPSISFISLLCCFIPSCILFASILSPLFVTVPPFLSSAILSFPFLDRRPSEEHSFMYMMVPKPLDSFNLLRVKRKGLKQKVLHASCEWYSL